MSLRDGAGGGLSGAERAAFAAVPGTRGIRPDAATALPASLPDAAAVVLWSASLAAQAGRTVVPVNLGAALASASAPADLRERIDLAVACGATGVARLAPRGASTSRAPGTAWDEALGRVDAYARRLCRAMRLGRDYAPVALLCAGEDPFAERPIVLALAMALLRSRVPVHVLPQATMPACRVVDASLRKDLARYRVVIVPPGAWEARGSGARGRLWQFAARGGVVLDFSDSQPDSGAPSADSWLVYDGPADVGHLASVASTHVERAARPFVRAVAREPAALLTKQRDLGGASIVWVLNTSARPQPVEIELGAPFERAERLDPERGDVEELPALFGGFRPQLEPKSGLLLRLSRGPATRARSSWFGHGPGNRAWVHLGGLWGVARASPNVATLALIDQRGLASGQREEETVTFRFRVEGAAPLEGVRLVALGCPRPERAFVGSHAYEAWEPRAVAGIAGWSCALRALPAGEHAGQLSIDAEAGVPRRWAIVLLGEFSAGNDSESVTLAPPVTAAPLADWAAAGLPDYAGGVEWERDVALPGSRPLVADISEQAPWFRSVCHLWVDDVAASHRWWPPYETDVSALVRGSVARFRYYTLAPVPEWRRYLAGAAAITDDG